MHDCGLTRSIGYFLEPLIVLGLFAKKPISIKLKGNSFICFCASIEHILVGNGKIMVILSFYLIGIINMGF